MLPPELREAAMSATIERPMRRRWLSVFSAAVMALGLASCGGGGGASSADAAPADVSGAPHGARTRSGPCVPVERCMQLADFLHFSINVQDFAYPERSAATVERILDLHERYGIPVDFYLTDTLLAYFEDNQPALMARLLASPVAGLAYHIRPPRPYYDGYDWAGLRQLDEATLYTRIQTYESHLLDLATGEPTARIGGFQHLRTLTGERPLVAAFSTDEAFAAVPAQVFADLGARFRIRHGGITNLGERRDGMDVRPEHFDLLLFESPGRPAAELIAEALTTAHQTSGTRAPYFVGVKMHDNDFFADHSAWTETYLNHGRKPVWDLSFRSPLLDDTAQAAQWANYEAAVAYAAGATALVGTVNAEGVADLLAAASASPLLYVAGTMHIENNPSTWPDPEDLKAFLARAMATGMRWSVGADIGYLTNDPRAPNLVRELAAMGVDWDIHAHAADDRLRVAETLASLGVTPDTVVSGLQIDEIDATRAEQVSPDGYHWRGDSLYGLTRAPSHAEGSEDFSFGLYRPASSAAWMNHDPSANLISIGGGTRDILEAEILAQSIAAGGYTAPVYSAAIMVSPTTLHLARSSATGIAEIEAWAARMNSLPAVRWATLRETATAWQAAGAVPSRIQSLEK